MGETTTLLQGQEVRYQFRVDYPYYGLFGSADITGLKDQEDMLFKCRLLNGSYLFLRKISSRAWIDTTLDSVTPLAGIIGASIDEYLRKH